MYNCVMDDTLNKDDIERAARAIREADRVCCLTGAGISAESGIPTFRGKDGFWAGRRAEDLATPRAFAADPEDVWAFYLWRRQLLADKVPNAGHTALADIERSVDHFTLVTQNVDGLHRRAGSERMIEIHGNLLLDRCTACGVEVMRTFDDVSDEIPYCDACGAMMRPGVVWFGEMLKPKDLYGAQAAAEASDVMLVVGTSSLVQPAASLSFWAKSNGATVIEVNPDATPLTAAADICFPHGAGAVLPAIASRVFD